MEAMASGLPVVAVRAGAIPELVKHGKNGYIYEPDDKESVARGIVRILSDNDLREKSSELAHKMSRVNASHQSIGKKVSESFKDAILKGRTKVIVGQKEFDVEQYFSKQIMRAILDYDDQDEDPEDDVSNKGPFNCLIK